MRPAEHFVKFFRQLPGLSPKELTLEDWEEFLSVEDRDEFRARVEVTFPGLSEKEKDRMAQFLYDKNQELLREAAEEQEASPGS
ncbi:MAG TPA: hypothetical protein VGR38_03700 [Candidatus Polarisedimenticolia bacterium]|jgi:hypothetical protein|nr:hypothetical protein [Candidatus Polarisedimenticolia bacterium]